MIFGFYNIFFLDIVVENHNPWFHKNAIDTKSKTLSLLTSVNMSLAGTTLKTHPRNDEF